MRRHIWANMTSYLGKYDIIFLASRHLNNENTTNTVKHRMHGIHFSTAKRLVRKWSYH